MKLKDHDEPKHPIDDWSTHCIEISSIEFWLTKRIKLSTLQSISLPHCRWQDIASSGISHHLLLSISYSWALKIYYSTYIQLMNSLESLHSENYRISDFHWWNSLETPKPNPPIKSPTNSPTDSPPNSPILQPTPPQILHPILQSSNY
jgi:hypothetical protein